jgi:hypothetical protein
MPTKIDDLNKIAEMLSNGGWLHVHPDDYARLNISQYPKVGARVIVNKAAQPGVVVAHIPGETK